MRVVYVLLALWPLGVSARPQQVVNDKVIFYDLATNQIIPESESTSSTAAFPVLFLNAFAAVQEPYRVQYIHRLFKDPIELALALDLSSIFGDWDLNANERMQHFVSYISFNDETNTHTLKAVLGRGGIWMAALFHKVTELSKNLPEEELQLVQNIKPILEDPSSTMNELAAKIKELNIASPAIDSAEMRDFGRAIEEAYPVAFMNAVASVVQFDALAEIIEKLFTNARDKLYAGVIVGHLAAPALTALERARNLDAFIASLDGYDRAAANAVLSRAINYVETAFSEIMTKAKDLPNAEREFFDRFAEIFENPRNAKADVQQQVNELAAVNDSPRLREFAHTVILEAIYRPLYTNDRSNSASPSTPTPVADDDKDMISNETVHESTSPSMQASVTNLNAFFLAKPRFLNAVVKRLFSNEESITHALYTFRKLTEQGNAHERVKSIKEYVDSQEHPGDVIEVIVKLELWMEKVLHEISVRSLELSPEVQAFIASVHRIISNAEDTTDELLQKLRQLHLSPEAADELRNFYETMEVFAYEVAADDSSTSTPPPFPSSAASEDTPDEDVKIGEKQISDDFDEYLARHQVQTLHVKKAESVR